MATPFKCSRCPKRDTRRCRLRLSPWPRSSSGSTLSCKLSPRISARRESSLRRLRRSVRTWYAAKSSDTTATLMIKGRTIFRVVRIMTPQPRRASPVAPELGRANMPLCYCMSVFVEPQYGSIPELGVTTTCTARLFPPSERYSTVACDPTVSMPSTVVDSSTRNFRVCLILFSFTTSTANVASPTDEIRPDTDCFSAAVAALRLSGCAVTGWLQTAIVKHVKNSVARLRMVRNLMRSLQIDFDRDVPKGTACAKVSSNFYESIKLFVFNNIDWPRNLLASLLLVLAHEILAHSSF